MKDDLLALRLAKYIKQAGSQKAAAKQLGISESYLSDIKCHRREPGEKVSMALGLRRVTVYEQAS